jgi:hypothetical protein
VYQYIVIYVSFISVVTMDLHLDRINISVRVLRKLEKNAFHMHMEPVWYPTREHHSALLKEHNPTDGFSPTIAAPRHSSPIPMK